ncbi:MAG: transglycosylase domain-containing protein [Spirochaetes bacterium]|nr:transglycosylase domain-containing protein [Spirochaetota bacterium]
MFERTAFEHVRSIVVRIAIGFLIVCFTGGLIYTATFIYTAFSIRSEWESRKEEAMRIVAEWHRRIVTDSLEKAQRAFNPNDPFGEVPPTRIYDRNGIVIGEYLPSYAEIVYHDEISPLLTTTLTIMEDQRFYQHKGVNVYRIVYLSLRNALSFRITGGGSTITQQLAKLLLTRSERTMRRKIFELFATIEIEKRYSKEDILAMYVNTVYLGDGVKGFEAASMFYFHKPLRRCRLVEYAIMVGMLPNPRYYSPLNHPERSRAKVTSILSRLVAHNRITKKTMYEELAYFDARYGKKLAEYVRGTQMPMSVNLTAYPNERVRQLVEPFFTRELLAESGMKIYTTIDYYQQVAAERALKNTLSSFTASNKIEGAVVTIVPQTGAIRVLVGGSGYFIDNQLNRAVTARRQIGSLIKPFIYANAFDSGSSPFTKMTDKAYSYPVGAGRVWTPRNYDGKNIGEITLHDALVKSVNTVTVQLLKNTGLSAFIDDMKKIYPAVTVNNNLSIGLGTIELTPLELAAGYSLFATGGTAVATPYLIERIVDKDGPVIIDDLKIPAPRSVDAFDATSVYLVNKTLADVVKEGGTGFYAAARTGFTHQVPSKSGTTSDARDAWYVLYCPALVSAVWIGNDNGSALPYGTTGGSIAAPVLFSYLGPFLDGMTNTAFVRPSGVEDAAICRDSGMLTNGSCTNIEWRELARFDKNALCTLGHTNQ